MQDIIKKLIEVDKVAREKIENARAKRTDVMSEIEKKRSGIKLKTEEDFRRLSLENRNKATEEFERKYSDDIVSSENAEAIKRLDSIYENNREKWSREIFNRVIGN